MTNPAVARAPAARIARTTSRLGRRLDPGCAVGRARGNVTGEGTGLVAVFHKEVIKVTGPRRFFCPNVVRFRSQPAVRLRTHKSYILCQVPKSARRRRADVRLGCDS